MEKTNKLILLALLLLVSYSGVGQPLSGSSLRIKTDTTTLTLLTGWGSIYYDMVRAKWRITDGAGNRSDLITSTSPKLNGFGRTKNNLPPVTHSTSFTLAPADTSKMHILSGGSGAIVITLGTFSGLSGKGLQFPFRRDRVDTVYFNTGSETIIQSPGATLGVADSTFAYLYYNGTTDKFYLANGGPGGSSTPALTDGNGTTVNGSAVDLGGDVVSPVSLDIGVSGSISMAPLSDPDLNFAIGISGINIQTASSRIFLDQSSEDITFTDDRGSPKGVLYDADYSTTMPALALIHKGYVDNAISGISAVPPTRTISTTAPLTGGGDLSANRTLSMPAAATAQNGYLTSTDWNTFNGKQNTISFGTGVLTALGINIGSAGSPVLFNAAGGTPSSINLSNGTALPASSVVNTPAGGIVATTVQSAINELDTEKQDVLGYIPLNPANNLSDVGSASTALQNLGGMEKTSVKNVQTGDYTLQASDFNTNTTIYMDNGSTPRTLTIPLAALASVPTIRTVLVRRLGTASVTIVGAVGTTITPPGGSNTDPGQGYLFAISKDGIGAATYTIDNGGVALGAANSILGVSNSGLIQEYKVVSNGLTAASGSIKLGGALTADTGLTGAFSLGVGTASPSAKLHVIGLGTGTGELFRIADNTPTTRLSILDNGKTTATASQSGATTIGYQWNNTWTATANSQTNTHFDFSTTSTVGAFTGSIMNYFQVRDNTAGTLFSMSNNGGMAMNGMILYDFKNNSSTSVVRNSAAALALRGGTSSTTRALQFGVNNASSTNNNVAWNFTGAIHDIIAGAQTRAWTGILNDAAVSAGDGNTITYIMNNKINTYSMGNCTTTITDEDYNPTVTGTGTITHIAKRIRVGLSGFGVGSTVPTAFMHLGAGSTGTAPMRFTSGPLTTGGNILAGNYEFLTDKWYGTITTGTVQKEFTMNDAALTSGTTPVATTNGRLTDGLILAASTYTPTLTNVTNATASTAYVTGYYRIGNSVTVYGKIDINPTLAASSATEVAISLPIASNMTAEQDLGGTAVSDALASLTARIKGDATNDRASVVFKSISVTNDSYSFEFSYQIK